MERTEIKESPLKYREGGTKMLKVSWNFVCVFGRLWKIREVKGEGFNSGYRFKGLIIWAGLAGFAEISAP